MCSKLSTPWPPHHSRCALLGLGVLFAPFLPAQSGSDFSAFANRLGYEQINLRRSGENRLFVFGKVEGRQRSVLVDTGWSYTTLSTNAARTLQAGGGAPEVLIQDLRLGRVQLSHEPARVQSLVFAGQRAPFELVLGCDFLTRHFALIDCKARRFYVHRQSPTRATSQALQEELRRGGFLAVDLAASEPPGFTCMARVNQQEVQWLVDTGAVWSCLDSDEAGRLGLKLLPTPRQISGVGAASWRGFAVTSLPAFELGPVEINGLKAAVFDLKDWGLATPGTPLERVRGILGGPELAAWSAIIDCHHSKLWLKPPTARR